MALDVIRRNRFLQADDFSELVKRECARLHLAYDSERVGAAVDIALMQRGRGRL